MDQNQSAAICKRKFHRRGTLLMVVMIFSAFSWAVWYRRINYLNQKTKWLNLTSRSQPYFEVVNACKFVTLGKFNKQQGLANQMFMFAALFYVGHLTGREIVIFNDHSAETLESIFDLQVRKINETCPCFSFKEDKISYDKRINGEMFSLTAENSSSILLRGLFQSWRYVKPVKDAVRRHLKFRKNIAAFAKSFLRNATPPGWKEGFVRVGVHNRRGNFVEKGAREFGLTAAPESYFSAALKYFADRFSSVQFIVVSQDRNWTMENVKFNSSSDKVNVTYSFGRSAGEDMATLSLCDHVIVSTGTFGWWSAWLANGTTVYYPHYPRNGSFLRSMIEPVDYYPPDWISRE